VIFEVGGRGESWLGDLIFKLVVCLCSYLLVTSPIIWRFANRSPVRNWANILQTGKLYSKNVTSILAWFAKIGQFPNRSPVREPGKRFANRTEHTRHTGRVGITPQTDCGGKPVATTGDHEDRVDEFGEDVA